MTSSIDLWLNPDLTQEQICRESDERRATINDAVTWTVGRSIEDGACAGVITLVLESFSVLQDLIEAVRPRKGTQLEDVQHEQGNQVVVPS